MAVMRMFARMVVLATLALGMVAAEADEGKARLDAFFQDLATMRAEFTQSVVDAQQRLKEESEGVLVLARPGRFRLEYTKPYSQLYVADGRKVWMYDKDLAQVTVREQEEALGSTPAWLLSTEEPLEKDFLLTELGRHEGLVWLELKPKEADANFSRIRIALDGGTLRTMEMVDGFGQTTRVQYHRVQRNQAVDDGLFTFTPPPGVDVVGE